MKHIWTNEENAILDRHMKATPTVSVGWESAANELGLKRSQVMGHYYDLINRKNGQAVVKKPRKPHFNIHKPDKPSSEPFIPLGKNPFPTINDSMKVLIIQAANKRLAEIGKEIEKMQPLYDEKKTVFELAKEEFENFATEWNKLSNEKDEQEQIIKTFVVSSPKEKVLKPFPTSVKVEDTKQRDSAFGKPVVHVAKRIKWLEEAANVLKERNEFMQPIDIWNAIIEKPHIKETLKTMKSAKTISTVRFATIQNWYSHAQLYAEDAAKSNVYKPFLTVYQNLLGLYTWVDQHNIPKNPEHMLPFVHGEVKVRVS